MSIKLIGLSVLLATVLVGYPGEPEAPSKPAEPTEPAAPKTPEAPTGEDATPGTDAVPALTPATGGKPGTAAKKAPTVLDSVAKGRRQLQDWRTSYVKTQDGECFYAGASIRIAIGLCQPEGSAARREVSICYASESSVAAGAHPTTLPPLLDERRGPFVVWGGTGIGTGWKVATNGASIDSPAALKATRGVTRGVVVYRVDDRVENSAIFGLADEVKGPLNLQRPTFFEHVGEGMILVERKGTVTRAAVPLYLGKPLETAHPTAEQLAAHIKNTGELLIHHTLKTDVTQKTRVEVQQGGTFTTRRTVIDGPPVYKYTWQREVFQVVFKP